MKAAEREGERSYLRVEERYSPSPGTSLLTKEKESYQEREVSSEEETEEQDTTIINMSTDTSTRELELQARIAELQQELVASRSVPQHREKAGFS